MIFFKKTKLDKFHIVGISVRTSNTDGKSIGDIHNLWKRFFSEEIVLSINNKVSDDVYCLYTDYDSDFMGEYTTIIGCKVSSMNKVPEGLVTKEIEASNYRVYVSEGKISESVGETWNHIWAEGKNINRTYRADFDLYDKDASDPNNAIVKTYLSVE